MPIPVLRAANHKASQPLPDPWPALANSRYEVQFLPAQFMLFAGPSGAGKTFLALDAALKMNVPTLYLSCDSDESTMVTRVTSSITGHSQREVRESMRMGIFKEVYGGWLTNPNLRFEFDPSNPSLQDIAHILEAYHEVEGQYPKMLILDNVMNLEGDSENEWAGMRKASKALHWIARKTKACLVALHHTSDPDDKWPSKAPPKWSIQGKITQMSPTIVTVYTDGYEMWLGVVKHRFGRSDPTAKDPLKFMVDLSKARIWDDEREYRKQLDERASSGQWIAGG